MGGPGKWFYARCACTLAVLILVATGTRIVVQSADRAVGGAAVPLPIFTDITEQAST